MHMSPKRSATFRIDDELLEQLDAIRKAEGIPVSEQVRRGILLWLNAKGGTRAERKRAVTRKRS